MYAIIRTGGKQRRVAVGETIDVELLQANEGDEVLFGEVLFFANGDKQQMGNPIIGGCRVKGQLLGTVAGPKIKSIKFKKRKRASYRRWGHRQHYSRVKITDIELG